MPVPEANTTTAAAGAPMNLAGSGNAAALTSSRTVAATSEPTVVPQQNPADEPAKTENVNNNAKEVTETPIQALWTCAQGHTHKEIWGVRLADPDTHVPSQIIFQKYLNANEGDLPKAKQQLKNTLDWRSESKPDELTSKKHSKQKFAGLGYITSYANIEDDTPDKTAVFTWNIYGGVKDIQTSFGDLDAFIDWRVALMEMAIRELDLSSAITPITSDKDPYKIYQVHDYKGISFLRSPPAVRTASKKTIEVLAMAYPETLREKFFVNVPAIMGFMYGVMKLFVAAKTIKKFHPMSNGALLVHEFSDSKVKDLGIKLPTAYGGKGEDLTSIGKEPLLE